MCVSRHTACMGWLCVLQEACSSGDKIADLLLVLAFYVPCASFLLELATELSWQGRSISTMSLQMLRSLTPPIRFRQRALICDRLSVSSIRTSSHGPEVSEAQHVTNPFFACK